MASSLVYKPYLAPPTQHQRAHLKHDYARRIACGVQMRGDDDTLPVIIYYGAPFKLLQDVMAYIKRIMQERLAGYVIRHEHSCRYKNGKAYRRVSVELHGIDQRYISLESMVMVINNYMQRICWCTVKQMSLRKLLNL